MTAERGGAIVAASGWGTAVFSATAVAASLVPALEPAAFVVAVALFAGGCTLFVVAYLGGVRRSRTDQVTLPGLFLLSGTAPSPVRRRLFGSLAVEVVVALGTAIARPYTSLAAGTLVPLYGLALCGLWAARHGRFPARRDRRRSGHPGDQR